MAKITVNFTFHSGLKRQLFRNVTLAGSWDSNGQFSNQWTEAPMTAAQDETGCAASNASVSFDAAQAGTTFQWGVVADIAGAPNTWVVVTEVPDQNSTQRYRSFILASDQTQQDYWFVIGRRFGAQKYAPSGAANPGIRFAVWAPHAKAVQVVFAPFNLTAGTPTGYIADDGTGVDPATAIVPLASKTAAFGKAISPSHLRLPTSTSTSIASTCTRSPMSKATQPIRLTFFPAIRQAVEQPTPTVHTMRVLIWIWTAS
jgi:1,4-alpha-glucan branching enzyme